jgi:hypothetical protein
MVHSDLDVWNCNTFFISSVFRLSENLLQHAIKKNQERLK